MKTRSNSDWASQLAGPADVALQRREGRDEDGGGEAGEHVPRAAAVERGGAAHPRRRERDERRLAKFRQNVARFRLYRLRFLQENMRFAAFFKIYQIFKLKFLKFGNILQILRHLRNFC